MKYYLLIFWTTFLIMNNVNGQSTKREDWTPKKASEWFQTGEFKNGWNVDAHSSIDAQEFAYQYHKNKPLWDKAFAFLKSTDLETIAPGKYVVDGDNVFISVMEGPTKDLEAARWEAHKKYIDIQYVINGKEKMGVVPVDKAAVTVNFDNAKDIGFYTAQEKDSKYYEATPKAFLIFFPNDVHRPGIRVEGCDSTKKLVVKIVAD